MATRLTVDGRYATIDGEGFAVPRVFQPTGMLLAERVVFGVFEPADHGVYVDLIPPTSSPSHALRRSTSTRHAGEMTTEADPGYPWSPLLQSGSVGYFEKSRGARVLRHGRIAARFTTNVDS